MCEWPWTFSNNVFYFTYCNWVWERILGPRREFSKFAHRWKHLCSCHTGPRILAPLLCWCDILKTLDNVHQAPTQIWRWKWRLLPFPLKGYLHYMISKCPQSFLSVIIIKIKIELIFDCFIVFPLIISIKIAFFFFKFWMRYLT